jgi:hypothetical protein
MATPHLCKSNLEIFCGGFSYIITALGELPKEISNLLNIPDTLVRIQEKNGLPLDHISINMTCK